MRLRRNTSKTGRGKYSLIENHKGESVEHGLPGTKGEFFVLKLADRHSLPALLAYAESIESSDREFAFEVLTLANRAGANSKWCKDPD